MALCVVQQLEFGIAQRQFNTVWVAYKMLHPGGTKQRNDLRETGAAMEIYHAICGNSLITLVFFTFTISFFI